MKNWLIRKLGAIPKDNAIEIVNSLSFSGPQIQQIIENEGILSIRVDELPVGYFLAVVTEKDFAAAKNKIKNL